MANITRLEVSNFKRISIVEIEPGTGAVLIAGRNAQGKSSVLDAIDSLLRGGKAYPSVPVRTGQAKAVVRCELDDGIVIERGITAAGTTSLKITNSEGMSPQHPQAWLDSRLSAATCDPLGFIRARPQDQAAELRRLTGVDTSDLDEQRKRIYDQRTQDGRTAKEKDAVLASMPEPGEDVPNEPVSASAIAAELDAAREVQAQRERLELDAARKQAEADGAPADADDTLHEATENANDLRQQAEDLRKRAGQLDLDADQEESRGKDAHANILRLGEEDAAEAAALRAEAEALTVPDIAAIRARLEAVDAVNDAVRRKQRRAEVATEAAQWAAKVQAHTEAIEDIDAERLAMLDGAEWPVDGLSIDGGVVTYQGVPLSQASQAEQIRVGLALALAGDPEIRVALVRDGSHLDDETLALLADEAERMGAQVWIERVGTHDAGAVVIEDGAVVDVAAVAAPVKAKGKNGGLI